MRAIDSETLSKISDNGESLRQLQRRVINVFQELIARHNGEHIALITHAGVIDIAYRYALARPLQTPHEFTIRNASVHCFACDEGSWSVLHRSNETKHAGSEAIE